MSLIVLHYVVNIYVYIYKHIFFYKSVQESNKFRPSVKEIRTSEQSRYRLELVLSIYHLLVNDTVNR